jgi:hypothetical protein
VAKVKFEMSLEKLSFKFEGDPELGSKLQTEIGKSFTALAETQAKLLPHDPDVIDTEPVTSNGNGKSKRAYRPRRPKSEGCRSLIVGLRRSGFFTEKRDINAIRAELAKSGHNFKPNEIASTLIPICKKRILKRDQNESGNYEYEQGDADVDSGNGEDSE